MKNFNEFIVENIKKNIPANIKVYRYLMDLLFISKESAYKRIRGQVPFTFEEIVLISRDINFSIDKIIEQHIADSNISQFIVPDISEMNIETFVLNFINDTCAFFQKMLDSGVYTLNLGLNRIPYVNFNYKHLFKMDYFRFYRSYNKNCKYSEIEISPKIKERQYNLSYLTTKLDNITCIFDRYIVDKTIKEIEYYYQINTITKDEVLILKEELLSFIEEIMKINLNIENHIFGSNCNFFISETSIDTNIIHYEYDDNILDQFLIYFEHPINIHQSRFLSSLNKRWFESRLRYSDLITNSNEKLLSKKYEDVVSSINKLECL